MGNTTSAREGYQEEDEEDERKDKNTDSCLDKVVPANLQDTILTFIKKRSNSIQPALRAVVNKETRAQRAADLRDLHFAIIEQIEWSEVSADWVVEDADIELDAVLHVGNYGITVKARSSAEQKDGTVSSLILKFSKTPTMDDDTAITEAFQVSEEILLNEALTLMLLSCGYVEDEIARTYQDTFGQPMHYPAFASLNRMMAVDGLELPGESPLVMSIPRLAMVVPYYSSDSLLAVFDPSSSFWNHLGAERVALRIIRYVFGLLLALQKSIHFTHRDLHAGNIVVHANPQDLNISLVDVAMSCADLKNIVPDLEGVRVSGGSIFSEKYKASGGEVSDYCLNRSIDCMMFCASIGPKIGEVLWRRIPMRSSALARFYFEKLVHIWDDPALRAMSTSGYMTERVFQDLEVLNDYEPEAWTPEVLLRETHVRTLQPLPAAFSNRHMDYIFPSDKWTGSNVVVQRRRRRRRNQPNGNGTYGRFAIEDAAEQEEKKELHEELRDVGRRGG
jgi:serine/threonine protein kinase